MQLWNNGDDDVTLVWLKVEIPIGASIVGRVSAGPELQCRGRWGIHPLETSTTTTVVSMQGRRSTSGPYGKSPYFIPVRMTEGKVAKIDKRMRRIERGGATRLANRSIGTDYSVFGGKRYEAGSCGRSSPDTLAF